MPTSDRKKSAPRKASPKVAGKTSQLRNSPIKTLNCWIVDATLEQHPGFFKGIKPATGDRRMDMQVSWMPIQWSPEKHIILTQKTRVIIESISARVPLSVTEITSMSEVEAPYEPAKPISSQDVFHMAQSAWPHIRSQLNALLGLGLHQPPLPESLPRPTEEAESQA